MLVYASYVSFFYVFIPAPASSKFTVCILGIFLVNEANNFSSFFRVIGDNMHLGKAVLLLTLLSLVTTGGNDVRRPAQGVM